MTDNEALIPRIKAILAEVRATSAETFQLQRLVVDYTERTVTTNDRERIAELERDLAAAKAELRLAWSDCEDATCEACASCVILAKDQRDFAVANLAQNAAITETLRAELALLKDGIEMNNGWPAHSPGATATPVVEEEQGPWVIYDESEKRKTHMFAGFDEEAGWGWTPFPDLVGFSTKEAALEVRRYTGIPVRVITLAEARRIAGAK